MHWIGSPVWGVEPSPDICLGAASGLKVARLLQGWCIDSSISLHFGWQTDLLKLLGWQTDLLKRLSWGARRRRGGSRQKESHAFGSSFRILQKQLQVLSYNCCCLCILEVNRIASNSKSFTTPPLPSCLAAASSSSRSPAGLKTGFHSLVWVTFCYRGMRRRKLTFWLWGWVFRLLGGSFVFALRSQNASALETINIYLWRMVGPQLLGSFRKDWLTTSWMASGCRMTSLLEERRLGAFLVLSWRRRRRSRGGRVVRLCLTTRLHPLWSRLWPRMRRTRSEPSMWIWGISLRIRCWLYSKLLVLNNMRQQRSVSRRKPLFPELLPSIAFWAWTISSFPGKARRWLSWTWFAMVATCNKWLC